MITIDKSKAEPEKNFSKVKGPIRCHKCQLVCRDAEHYLSHKCDSTRSRGNSFRESSQIGASCRAILVSLN
jgi:hypothetical protein